MKMFYWKFTDKEGNITSVESHSYAHLVPGGTQISKEEYDNYIASLPLPSPPPETLVFNATLPGQTIDMRVKNIEGFLKKVYLK